MIRSLGAQGNPAVSLFPYCIPMGLSQHTQSTMFQFHVSRMQAASGFVFITGNPALFLPRPPGQSVAVITGSHTDRQADVWKCNSDSAVPWM